LPLFARDALASLIDAYPREHYGLVHMGERGEDRGYWREGDINGMPGDQVIDAISKGRFWLNLRNTSDVDSCYRGLLKEIFDELHTRIPGFTSYGEKLGILISSPKANVYYHHDNPGQILVQIAGRKRVYVYPPESPFLTPEALENIAVTDTDLSMHSYAHWFDEYAHIFEAEPGQMMYWPLNSPHRVENHDSLNISLTLEFFSGDIRRSNVVSRANWLLRNRFGWRPRSRATAGPSFWAKAALWTAYRKSSWVEKQTSKPIQFRLDQTASGMMTNPDNG
jgi:Cupin-like domain